MDRKDRIEREVQATLRQFERTRRPTPGPFFYSRVQARLREQDRAKGRIPLAGVLKPALFLLLVACNVATAALLLKDGVAVGINHSAVVSAVGEELQLDIHDTDLLLTE